VSEYYDREDAELPYCLFGAFALYVRDVRGRGNEAVAARAAAFINSLAAAHHANIDNLLMVGFFEVVSDDRGGPAMLRKHLSREAALLLDEITAFWRGER